VLPPVKPFGNPFIPQKPVLKTPFLPQSKISFFLPIYLCSSVCERGCTPSPRRRVLAFFEPSRGVFRKDGEGGFSPLSPPLFPSPSPPSPLHPQLPPSLTFFFPPFEFFLPREVGRFTPNWFNFPGTFRGAFLKIPFLGTSVRAENSSECTLFPFRCQRFSGTFCPFSPLENRLFSKGRILSEGASPRMLPLFSVFCYGPGRC